MTTDNTKESLSESLQKIMRDSTHEIIDILNKAEKILNELGFDEETSAILTETIAQVAVNSAVFSHFERYKEKKMFKGMEQFMSMIEKENLTNDDIH